MVMVMVMGDGKRAWITRVAVGVNSLEWTHL